MRRERRDGYLMSCGRRDRDSASLLAAPGSPPAPLPTQPESREFMDSTRRGFARTYARPLAGLLALGAWTPRAEAQLHGVDVSHYQGNVNWTAVKNAGLCPSPSPRRPEGTTYTDPLFAHNWYYMQQAGIIRGAYHFGHPGQRPDRPGPVLRHPGRQPRRRSSSCSTSRRPTARTPAQVWAWAQSFMAEIQRLTGRPGIIYTGYYFWSDSVGNPTNNLNCPLWIAAYGVSSPTVPRRLVVPGPSGSTTTPARPRQSAGPLTWTTLTGR